MARSVTPKMHEFVNAYLLTSNASDAYRSAYQVRHMSARSIYQEASKLLAHPKVAAEIERRLADLAQRNVVTVESLTRELLAVARQARGGAGEKESPALGAAVQALKTVAQLHGLLRETKETKGTRGVFVMEIVTESKASASYNPGP